MIINEITNDTIVALSSGSLPSGVAVVRISGSQCNRLCNLILPQLPQPRIATLQTIYKVNSKEELDRGLVLWFPQPNSFTGEDCIELHLHGGRAVVDAVINSICSSNNIRIAEPGEFSRRAFENGKLDLTEVEGIADLVSSETEAQRKQALAQTRGDSRETFEGWRKRLIHMRAMIEAELDFSEEEDVPEEISEKGFAQVLALKEEISSHLENNKAGEIIRDGYKIVLMGKPNAGKSSLLNALAKRDVAIVTNEAGTTRDVLDVHLNIDGYSVIISDTAGIRKSDNSVEIEGIKRANLKGNEADLVIWLYDFMDTSKLPDLEFENVLFVSSKNDDLKHSDNVSISIMRENGIDQLFSDVRQRIKNKLENYESGLISRTRHRLALEECINHLSAVINNNILDIELKAETLRHASDCIGKITGKVDVEDLLDVIFSEFCVGK